MARSSSAAWFSKSRSGLPLDKKPQVAQQPKLARLDLSEFAGRESCAQFTISHDQERRRHCLKLEVFRKRIRQAKHRKNSFAVAAGSAAQKQKSVCQGSSDPARPPNKRSGVLSREE